MSSSKVNIGQSPVTSTSYRDTSMREYRSVSGSSQFGTSFKTYYFVYAIIIYVVISLIIERIYKDK
jgi:hypothetical protein